MNRLFFLILTAISISMFLTACATTEGDGIKSETCTRQVSTKQHIVIE